MIAAQMVHDGTRGRLVRAASVFRHSSPTNTATVWAPEAGKRFRLLGYSLEVTGGAYLAAAGDLQLQLFDEGTNMNMRHLISLPASAPTAPPGVSYRTGWVDLGPLGYLSTTSSNTLRVLFSAALAGGSVVIRMAGTEESPADSVA